MLVIIGCFDESNQTPQLIKRDQSTNKLFDINNHKGLRFVKKLRGRSTRNNVFLVDEDYGSNRSSRERMRNLIKQATKLVSYISSVYGEIVDDCSNPKEGEVK